MRTQLYSCSTRILSHRYRVLGKAHYSWLKECDYDIVHHVRSWLGLLLLAWPDGYVRGAAAAIVG